MNCKQSLNVWLVLAVIAVLVAFGQLMPVARAQEETPTPATILYGVWGSAANDVFAVGDDGTVLHYDGTAWSAMEGGAGHELHGVWGSAANDVFAVGVGKNARVLHYDGNAWSDMRASMAIETLMGVWGSSSRDVFAVGTGGTLLHSTGRVWLPVSTSSPDAFQSVWGSSGEDVFAVGGYGAIIHYDGHAWSSMASGCTDYLTAVWGSSGGDVFVVGGHGTILHYDGAAWTAMESGTTEQLNAVWGSSGSDVFAVGRSGTVLHYDGAAWSAMRIGTTDSLNAVWGSSGSDVFTVGFGATILHYDGSVWSQMSCVVPAAEPTSTPPAVTSTAEAAKPTPMPMAAMESALITSPALAGNLLGDPADRRIYIILPPGYATSSDKRYPVVYVMPWGDGAPYDNAVGFKRSLEVMLRAGKVREMIAVVPDATNKLGASQFRSSSAIGDYETYITRDLVEYMDTHYRTLPARESRALSGCCAGGYGSMRLGLKYPNVFSVIAATDGNYIDSPDVWPTDLENVKQVTKLPESISDLRLNDFLAWQIQAAAGVVPDLDNPPFYCEMPIRIVDGQGEFVPEVMAKIYADDCAHHARRYLQQPVRLNGIYIRYDVLDTDYDLSVHAFEKLLTELGIEHEFVEVANGYHCGYGWEDESLTYIASKLVFEK